MRRDHWITHLTRPAIAVCLLAATCGAQTTPAEKKQVSPGFLLRDNGVIDIGSAYAEINYYDSHWTIAQQHDRFTVNEPAKTTADGQIELVGTLATASSPAKVIETITPTPSGIAYTASLQADVPLESNELGLALILPLAEFGGKQMQVDGQAVDLSMTPAAKGQAVLFTRESVHELKVPTPKGMLTIAGQFALKLNDDREWNDPRYSLRLLFTPGTGRINKSSIDLIFDLHADK